ncbi:MAG: hypothetical protein DHS20C11_02560 [Lysobacteraceae bacterium]|nr:MAG: hypothetical protein DHS20C11_02560 [Xanthomonadaceae bacterium]
MINRIRLVGASVCVLFSISAAQANCLSMMANEVGNCGFEDNPIGMTWLPTTADSIARTTAIQRSGAASLEIDAFESSPGFVYVAGAESECFAVTASADYGFGAFFRLDAVTGPTPQCNVGFQSHNLADCSDTVVDNLTTGDIDLNTTTFTEINSTGNTVSGNFAQLSVGCRFVGAASDFLMYADDAYAGPSLMPVDLQSFSIQ